jgi:hypothetical protein
MSEAGANTSDAPDGGANPRRWRTWRLTEKLGEGTLSEVWRAAQEPLGRDRSR